MKKTLFLLWTLLLYSVMSMNAQVTIGENDTPHPGATLDLRGPGGLLLSKMSIFNADVFQLAGDPATAVGMIVYNTNADVVNGRGIGVYVWNGSKWMSIAVGGIAGIPVTSVTVSSAGGAVSVMSGSTLQFSAAVQPSNAVNNTVVWSVVPGGTGNGSIDPSSGLFTAGVAGTVTIRATATDGSNVYGEMQITVTPGPVPVAGIAVTAAGGATGIDAPGTLQLTAMVIPDNATNQLVTWSIVSGTGASVDQTGLVTATCADNIVVRATSDANNTIYGEISLANTSTTYVPGPGTVVGVSGTEYNTYCFDCSTGLGCWMTDNSKEGTATITNSLDHPGYYYALNQANPMSGSQYTACPVGWHLPNSDEWTGLITFINGPNSSPLEKSLWFGSVDVSRQWWWPGWRDITGGASQGWEVSYTIASTTSLASARTTISAINPNVYFAIRCVKD